MRIAIECMVKGCDKEAKYRIEWGTRKKVLYVCEDCYNTTYKNNPDTKAAEKIEEE